VPAPSRLPVVPLREGLLQPLHYIRKFQPVLRLDVKRKQIAFKAQATNLEDKPKLCLMKHPAKNIPDFRLQEQGFPGVDLGADFVPDTLLEYS
jgi:hypothetical protein